MKKNWNKRCDRLALEIGYINKTHTQTHTQSGAENSLFQFWLTIAKPFSPFYFEETTNYITEVSALMDLSIHGQLIMRVNKPTIAYKLAPQ